MKETPQSAHDATPDGAARAPSRRRFARLPWGPALAVALALAAAAPACSGTIGGGVGQDTSSTGAGGPDDVEPDPLVAAPGGMRRLVKSQYVGSIRAIFGDAAAAVAAPPDDAQLHGLDALGAAELALSDVAIEAYETSARNVADAFVRDPQRLATLLPCTPTGPEDVACYRAFAARAGRLAWRRRLTGEEVTRLAEVGRVAGAAYGDRDAGLVNVVSALLQSPNFLYVIEVGDPDIDGTGRHLTPTELVTRMSFFLLDRAPDEALLDEAESGVLQTDDDVRAVARAMVESSGARAALDAFYDELFRLRELDTLAKDTALFPQYTPGLKAAMRDETLRLIGDIVWDRDADARELFSADYTFVNAELAGLYGVPAPAGGGFERVDLPATQGRAGILGHASVLARFAHPAATSPTRRGLFVRTMLLCQKIDPPPPGQNTTLPPDPGGQHLTMKEKLELHATNPSCGGCHNLIDPIGLSMEHFDAVGAYRDHDLGVAIEADADVADLGAFASPAELGALLHDNDEAAACLVKNVYRDSMGHLETVGEAGAVRDLVDAFAAGGYRMQDLLVELCASPAFRIVGEPK
jgi:hypothetical protein